MVVFSSDSDILKYEPILFGELHLRWQVVASGTGGTVSGTSFSAAGADFTGGPVSAGGVVYLWSSGGVLDGPYEIVSVDSATELTVSVIRAEASGPAVAPPAATDVSYRISTFEPQAAEVGFELTEYFGIRPGEPSSGIEASDLVNTEALQRASVLGVISRVYALLAGRSRDEDFWRKAEHYGRLYRRACQRCRFSIDAGGDGAADVTRSGASGKLSRD